MAGLSGSPRLIPTSRMPSASRSGLRVPICAGSWNAYSTSNWDEPGNSKWRERKSILHGLSFESLDLAFGRRGPELEEVRGARTGFRREASSGG